MILAYRQKTKCKQYVFVTIQEAFQYFKKKCYWMELITLYEYDDNTNREINRITFRNEWTK